MANQPFVTVRSALEEISRRRFPVSVEISSHRLNGMSIALTSPLDEYPRVEVSTLDRNETRNTGPLRVRCFLRGEAGTVTFQESSLLDVTFLSHPGDHDRLKSALWAIQCIAHLPGVALGYEAGRLMAVFRACGEQFVGVTSTPGGQLAIEIFDTSFHPVRRFEDQPRSRFEGTGTLCNHFGPGHQSLGVATFDAIESFLNGEAELTN